MDESDVASAAVELAELLWRHYGRESLRIAVGAAGVLVAESRVRRPGTDLLEEACREVGRVADLATAHGATGLH